MRDEEIFEINGGDIDIEVIIKKLKANIASRGMETRIFPSLGTVSQLEGGDNNKYNQDNLRASISYLNSGWTLETDKSIASHRPLIGGSLVLFKRIIRKLIGWYTRPVFMEQSKFNANVTRALIEISLFMNSYLQAERYEQTIKALNQELSKFQVEFKSFKEREKNSASANYSYLEFEDAFRGTREDLIKKQAHYLKYFKHNTNILDIGCGRGEFLELVSSQLSGNIKGIDVSQEMINYCLSKNLPSELADACQYLESLEDNSLDGIFCAQVVEHLDPNYLIELISKVYSKLQPEGVVVIETINPRCLSVFANAFYMDLSHIKPVHPFTLEFLLKSAGFKNINVVYLSELETKIPEIEADTIKNLEEVNSGIQQLNKIIFGYQDYAIIANK